MKHRWLARTAAIVCAICLAMGVMSQTVFARDNSLSQDDYLAEMPQATFVVLNGETDPTTPAPEVIDNRLNVPLYVGGGQAGTCDIIGGVPYMSVTAFFDAAGLDAQVIDYGSALSLAMQGIMLTAQAGQNYFVCNERYLYVENGVQNLGGALALPVELLVKCTGLTASWDRLAWQVNVNSGPAKPLESGETYYDQSDLYWLSRLIFAMAGTESFQTRVAVGSVCVNRLGNPAFAGQSNIYEVVFAKNQFDMVTNGMIYVEPDEDSVLAAKLALEGCDPVGGATYVSVNDLGAGYERVAQMGKLQFFEAA